jgi:hypothetical protein
VRREQPRQGRPGRLPWRRAACIEDAIAWLLTAIGLLVTVLALATGVGLYEEGVHRMAAEAGDRTRIDAVLLEAAPANFVASPIGQSGRPVPVPVPARYTTPDGVEHVADVWVLSPRAAGTAVPIWVDRTGAVTTEPTRRADVAQVATFAAVVIVIVISGVLVLGGIWALARIGVRRGVLARWERQWAQVEPKWSGRRSA